MHRHIAGLTLFKEILDFFGTRFWKLDFDGQELTSKNEELDLSVRIKKGDVKFRVTAEAVDDPTDRLDVVTTKPMKELTKFLSAGLPEGAFESYASSPTLFAKILRRTASKISQLGPKRTANFLRQAIIILSMDSLRDLIASITKIAVGPYAEVEVNNMFTQMKKKGWDVEETKSDDGRAEIKANFHDLYDITVLPNAVEYEYEYVIDGYPESMFWGTTEDPIRMFEDWMSSDRFNKSANERNQDIDSGELDEDKFTAKDVIKTIQPKSTPEAFAPTVPSERNPDI